LNEELDRFLVHLLSGLSFDLHGLECACRWSDKKLKFWSAFF
jgi:hypothetical protein